jgi:hypothetical protein
VSRAPRGTMMRGGGPTGLWAAAATLAAVEASGDASVAAGAVAEGSARRALAAPAPMSSPAAAHRIHRPVLGRFIDEHG